MSQIDYIVRDILDEGLDDWVPIDSLIELAREIEPDDGRFQSLTKDALHVLLSRGLVEAGRIGDDFVSEGSSEETFRRVVADCEASNWAPLGGGYWLANTKAGTRFVKGDR